MFFYAIQPILVIKQRPRMIANKAKYNTASGLASSSLELSTNLASQSSLVGHSQDLDLSPESRPSPTVHKGLDYL